MVGSPSLRVVHHEVVVAGAYILVCEVPVRAAESRTTCERIARNLSGKLTKEIIVRFISSAIVRREASWVRAVLVSCFNP